MFFNRHDIDWFKPVELSSKYGRRGKKEHLQFDGFFFFLKVYFSIITTSMFRSMLDLDLKFQFSCISKNILNCVHFWIETSQEWQ